MINLFIIIISSFHLFAFFLVKCTNNRLVSRVQHERKSLLFPTMSKGYQIYLIKTMFMTFELNIRRVALWHNDRRGQPFCETDRKLALRGLAY